MDKLASRGWTHVDTEEEAQQARRDVFVRGILIEERNIGAGGATTPLQRILCHSVGAYAPLGRVMSFIRVPVKPHPDQVLLDKMYTLANSGTTHNDVLQAAGCRLMKTRGTATLRDVRAEHAALEKLKSGTWRTTLLNQLDAARQSQRAAESALNARCSADLVGQQQCHTSALAALCAAKEVFDTQKSDERVSVDSLFLLRDRWIACQTEVDGAKKALDHLAAAHAWVGTSRAAQPSALFADIATLDELVALRDQVHTFRAVVDAAEASLRSFDVNVADIGRDLPQFARQAKLLQARVAERVEAHASDQCLAEAALQAMKKERHDAGRRCVERGDRDGARAAETQRNAIQGVADLVHDDATAKIAGDEAMLEIRVKKDLRLVLPQAVCAPTEAALTNALAAKYFARSLVEACAGLAAGGDLAYAAEVKQEEFRIAQVRIARAECRTCLADVVLCRTCSVCECVCGLCKGCGWFVGVYSGLFLVVAFIQYIRYCTFTYLPHNVLFCTKQCLLCKP